MGEELPAQQPEDGEEAWEGEDDTRPAQPLSQEQVLKEVATAAALQPMSNAQKVAAVRKISLEEAAAIVAEYEVVEPTGGNKQVEEQQQQDEDEQGDKHGETCAP